MLLQNAIAQVEDIVVEPEMTECSLYRGWWFHWTSDVDKVAAP
jgi:hypothetical protein